MRARSALLACVLGLAAAPARALDCRSSRVAAEITASRVEESPGLALGLRGMFNVGCLAAGLSLDFPAQNPRSEPGFDHALLAGLGGTVELHPRVSAYALAVGGTYSVLLRDYIAGEWRGTSFYWYSQGYWSWAWGGTAGLAVRLRSSRDGSVSFPVLGVSVTGLRVTPGSDRLRGVSWGGWQPVLTASLGVAFGGRTGSAAARRDPLRPSPELLDRAVRGQALEVGQLLASGADPDTRDDAGATALHLACTATSNDATVWRLLSAGADVHAVDARGATPLHWAATSRRVDAARLLLQRRADPNARAGLAAYTPLHAAAASGDLATAELLLRHGAGVGGLDAWGRTPVDVALAGGHARLAERLRSAGGRPGSPAAER